MPKYYNYNCLRCGTRVFMATQAVQCEGCRRTLCGTCSKRYLRLDCFTRLPPDVQAKYERHYNLMKVGFG